jgi:hypothetical protein
VKQLLFLLALATLPAAAGADTAVQDIHCDAPAPQCSYATRRLEETLADSRVRHSVMIDVIFELSIDPALGPEAFSIKRRRGRTHIVGGDARGMIYGALEAREQLLNGVAIGKLAARSKSPRLAFRGIKFNTPWDSYRPSSAIDQHNATARDLRFWEAYLDMMVENRFNAFTLWTMHPFTYMIRPKNFPEASKWTDAEFAEWRHLYLEVFRMAKERGLDTYVVFWSIFVSPEFAKAHNPASKNFYPHYYVEGDTSEITRRYLRESVTQMLEEYPDLDGIGVSHGEGMAGMTPLQRQQFVDEVYVAGALEARKSRPVKLIHRVPFSSGLSSGPGVSADVEKITRDAMEKLGSKFSGPIWVEMKFNWSHGHSTPDLIKVHGGKLGDTYFKPAPSNYKIVWQVRNEDFFALRWGQPDFIRQHLYRNGRAGYVGGYFVGSETYIPALDYFTAVKGASWRYAFERQWLFYKMWGRLLYDPETSDLVFRDEFTRRYGASGGALFDAYRKTSLTPLILASLYDSRWDFTLYSEGLLALQGEVTKYIGIDAFIEQPALDPHYVPIRQYVDMKLAGKDFTSSSKPPPATAARLEHLAKDALAQVRDFDPGNDVALRYEIADIKTWANLALHLAAKLRGAVELQFYRVAGGEEHRQAAIMQLTRALEYWDEVIRITRPLYKDMRLTHYNGNSFDANPDNLFHWALIRDEVAADIEVARGTKTRTETP